MLRCPPKPQQNRILRFCSGAWLFFLKVWSLLRPGLVVLRKRGGDSELHLANFACRLLMLLSGFGGQAALIGNVSYVPVRAMVPNKIYPLYFLIL